MYGSRLLVLQKSVAAYVYYSGFRLLSEMAEKPNDPGAQEKIELSI